MGRPSPLKVGVLTFHRCINYGSYWQARCLVEGLRRRGCDAVLLDHQSSRVNRAEWRCALQPLLPRRSSPAERALYAAKARRFFRAFERLPLSRPFPLDRPEAMEAHDLVIVGSDEVWNLRHPWYGGVPAFYGEGLRSPRMAAYAASFGNQQAGLDRSSAQRLGRFAHLSVRDDNSRRMIRDALDVEPNLVLDPCLQFSDIIDVPGPAPLKDYIVVYGHGFPDWFKSGVLEFARRSGKTLVSLGYASDWTHEQWIDAGPEDFARCIAGANAVATNFFHGCVFSLLNGKPFACVLSDYRSNKVRDLMRSVGAEPHLLSQAVTAKDFDRVLAAPPEGAIAERIAAGRQQSNAYLDAILD